MADRTAHFLRQKEKVVRLLKNWGDIFPSASAGVVVIGQDPNAPGPRTPLNPAVLRRMGNNREAVAYKLLDKALQRLAREYPSFYREVHDLYLTGEVGELEVEDLRKKAEKNPELKRRLTRHDLGVKWLTLWLLDEDVTVRWPDHTRYLASRDKMYSQVERIYASFLQDGKAKTEAVDGVVEYYDGAIGRSTVWRIVKSAEEQGTLPKVPRRKKAS
ncbi:MAG: hypothetical protein M3P49_01950 [Actinomycetota bacterium]|nr:hypothetical protein [Actinomycetota bacterium]